MTLELLNLVKADHYVISTSGRRFKHPDPEAMARVITRGRRRPNRQHTLWFNYVTETTAPWMQPALLQQYHYRIGDSVETPGAKISLSGSLPDS